ncbi:MAG TPA: hypothetical protein ACFYD6_11335 [Candidatus Brocadiia bacterium]|nr:hypothetical protein [Candidatus Brocadiales bacterium]
MSDLLKKGLKGENNFPPSTPDIYPANGMTQPVVSAVAAYLPSKIKAQHVTFSTGCRTTKNYT